jgi:hypothetical protein
MPTRFCTKNTGPGLLIFTAAIMRKNNGESRTSPTALKNVSMIRFINR